MAEKGRHRKVNRRERNRDRGRSPAPSDTPSGATDALADPADNWAAKTDSPPYQQAVKLYKLIQKAYDNKEEQAQALEEYWNIYNAQPDENQQYTGNAQGYIPAVRDCLNARAKRSLKQLFPVNNRHVEAVSSDGREPKVQMALLEHYIRKTGLKEIVRSDLIAGDVTGQWNLMVDWTANSRTVTNLVRRNPIVQQIDGEDVGDLEIEDPTSEKEDTETEEVREEGPVVIDFATEDLAVIPPNENDLQKATAV